MSLSINAITIIRGVSGVKLPTDLPISDTTPDAGVIGPGSMTWRIHQEQWLLLGVAPALLLQIAHPFVAQGVIDHSPYQSNPFGRVYCTYAYMTMLLCGSTREAHTAARIVNHMHHRITGTLTETIGPYRAGDTYCAMDVGSLLWVHVAFVESMLTAYKTFVHALTDDECEQYWQESRRYAHLLGLTDALLPKNYAAMRDYELKALCNQEIIVGNIGRCVAQTILHPPLPIHRQCIWALVRLLAVGQLPEGIREAYGLRWFWWDKLGFGVARRICRLLRFCLQDFLGHSPSITFAEKRARGEMFS